MAYFRYFPQELIDLRQELTYHPDLQAIIRMQPNEDIYIHILEIAAYCDILVAGTYTHDEILELCTMLTKKLQAKRIIVVN